MAQKLVVSMLFFLGTWYCAYSQHQKEGPLHHPGAKPAAPSPRSTGIELLPMEQEFNPMDVPENSWMAQIQFQRAPDESGKPGEEKKPAPEWKRTALCKPDSGSTSLMGPTEVLTPNPLVISSFSPTELPSFSPGDNAVAVSNAGYILTANNQNVMVYSPSGTLVLTRTLSQWVGNTTLSVFDPQVLYDSSADRFIFVCCKGSTPATSKVVVMFSKTNNPTGSWNTYNFTGNAYNNSCWFDYPLIGLSDQEIYVTGNLFKTDGSFSKAMMFQISKSKGYAGQSLSYKKWDSFGTLANPIFSLCPLSWGGSGNYGPGCYFVAHAFDPSWGYFTYLYDLTGYLTDPNAFIDWDYYYAGYFEIGDPAVQKGTTKFLNVNDCRINSGFYKDGTIHYVFHANNGSSGWNAVQYHRLAVATGTITQKSIYSSNSYDYCYPSIAWAGTAAYDKSAIIAFEHSGPSSYPGAAVVAVDNAMNASPSAVTFASGTSFVNDGGNTGTARWGDYARAVRKANTTTSPRIYVAAGLGHNANTERRWWHKVAIIGPGSEPSPENTGESGALASETRESVPTVSPAIASSNLELAPNPVPRHQACRLRFEVPFPANLRVEVIAATGSQTQVIFEDGARAGTCEVSFNAQVLPPGVYFVRAIADGHVLATSQLVVAP